MKAGIIETSEDVNTLDDSQDAYSEDEEQRKVLTNEQQPQQVGKIQLKKKLK
jgi:hypothetical protein